MAAPEVVAAGTPAEPVDTPAATALDTLKDRLEAARAALSHVLQVPRWAELIGFPVYVEYGPIDGAASRKRLDMRRNSRVDDWETLWHADVLVSCCRAVFAVRGTDAEGRPARVSLAGEDAPLTRFDPELAEVLGVPRDPPSAVAVARKLYFTDGDLDAAYMSLLEWSTAMSEKADEGFTTPFGATP